MLTLNSRSTCPIHQQVQDELRHLMITGVIGVGEKLPSVRTLASSLAINPNTIQRAYEALEQEGYLQSVPGKGSFASRPDQVSQVRRQQLLQILEDTARELHFLGMTQEELLLHVTRVAPNQPNEEEHHD